MIDRHQSDTSKNHLANIVLVLLISSKQLEPVRTWTGDIRVSSVVPGSRILAVSVTFASDGAGGDAYMVLSHP